LHYSKCTKGGGQVIRKKSVIRQFAIIYGDAAGVQYTCSFQHPLKIIWAGIYFTKSKDRGSLIPRTEKNERDSDCEVGQIMYNLSQNLNCGGQGSYSFATWV